MGSAKRFLVVGSLLVAGQSAVMAADYPQSPPPAYYPPPPPVYQPAPPPIVYQSPPIYTPPPPPPVIAPPPPIIVQPAASDSYSGWYLRGDIGLSSQSFSDFGHTQTANFGTFTWPASWTIQQKDLKDTMTFGIGVGYQFNSWLRFDVTGEYRQSTKGKAVGSYTEFCPGGTCFDEYDFDHQASVVLANVYLDLGTWWCFTPFVGVGLGAAYHTFDSMTDLGLVGNQSPGFGYSSGSSHDWTFAYAIHAGVSYDVTRNFKVELAYRYLNLGSPDTGIINCSNSGCGGATGGPQAFYTLNDLTANEFRFGVRWLFDCCDVAPPPPPPVYQPVFQTPPLMRRG